MATIVIGGHSRKVGKTSVTEGVIRAFRNYPWTAVKITTHWHVDSPSREAFLIHEETSTEGETDSARYLAAGASRAFWVQVRRERMTEAMPSLVPILQSSLFTIVESNAVLRHIRPDLYVMVLRYDLEEFKESARETLHRADAAVAINSESSPPAWKGFVEKMTAGIPIFAIPDPNNLTGEFLNFVKSRLGI